jgi:hypothetical protein
MRSATLRATVCVMSSDQAVRTRPASRWVTAAAYAVPLCILPSALWRLTVALNGGPERSGNCGGSADRGLQLYLVGLSAGSLVLGLLTVGLVRPWGEVFPRWWEILRWYAPLIAWPPLLGVVTLDYWRRRVRS